MIKGMSVHERRILKLIAEHNGQLGYEKIAKILGIKTKWAKHYITKLFHKGFIKHHVVGYMIQGYALTPEGWRALHFITKGVINNGHD